jgi:hypothetical protein
VLVVGGGFIGLEAAGREGPPELAAESGELRVSVLS